MIAKQERVAAFGLDRKTKRLAQGPRLGVRLGTQITSPNRHRAKLAKPQAAIRRQGLDR